MKPRRLLPGDTIAAISPSWGCAGAPDIRWRYALGVRRLEALGLHVVSAPNALRGEAYLDKNPQARADDLMWAFENKEVNAIIANIGGNDSHRILPYLSPESITQNSKILCGYSDITTLHLYCHKLGLSTFYGSNLLTTIAENGSWHPYSKHWFKKALFSSELLGTIPSSSDWSPDPNMLSDPTHQKQYIQDSGYMCIQGSGAIRGKLFGGNGETLMLPENSSLLSRADFDDHILFIEDISNTWSFEYIQKLLDWLGDQGYLAVLNGIVIGKFCSLELFKPFAHFIRSIVSEQYGLYDLPILYGLNFGHSSPICTLPYDAQAEINMEHLSFSITNSSVL